MPPGPPELAVGDRLQADLLLLGDDLLDLFILDPRQFGIGDGASLASAAGFLQRRRAQKTADLVGAKGRPRA